MNASHVVILTTRTDVPDEHLDAVFAQERADSRFPDPAKQELWESMTRDFLESAAPPTRIWTTGWRSRPTWRWA